MQRIEDYEKRPGACVGGLVGGNGNSPVAYGEPTTRQILTGSGAALGGTNPFQGCHSWVGIGVRKRAARVVTRAALW
jgi:hypothetical protein